MDLGELVPFMMCTAPKGQRWSKLSGRWTRYRTRLWKAMRTDEVILSGYRTEHRTGGLLVRVLFLFSFLANKKAPETSANHLIYQYKEESL